MKQIYLIILLFSTIGLVASEKTKVLSDGIIKQYNDTNHKLIDQILILEYWNNFEDMDKKNESLRTLPNLRKKLKKDQKLANAILRQIFDKTNSSKEGYLEAFRQLGIDQELLSQEGYYMNFGPIVEESEERKQD